MKFIAIISFFIVSSCSFKSDQSLRTVESVDVSKYIGKWYAISSFPQFFTRNCLGQTAEYGVIDPLTISVVNTCLKEKGETEKIEGQAVVVDKTTNAQLEVTFDNFFTRLFRVKGDYNIIDLDTDYKYVTVASHDRKSLWIMSRTPAMPEEIYKQYVQKAKDQNFPVEKLEMARF